MEHAFCQGLCENTLGSYLCSCPEGYSLGSDQRSCVGKFIIMSSLRRVSFDRGPTLHSKEALSTKIV